MTTKRPASPVAQQDVENTQEDLTKLTVKQLKSKLETLGESTTGVKAVLIERLKRAAASPPATTTRMTTKRPASPV
eukprot:CAMPEP_0175105018 /NCGR_PEP_ID=MMETSP0086_2-20121207/10137_1 /TAXON_ID=136419 /ORGANISM="Unknown Unknown, Strain D1" /LENGTH=75 /DNA_ID=CAMNT_0016380649 /DNA_START=35 /DNA_END=258 /DNA_ORIENTATION=+